MAELLLTSGMNTLASAKYPGVCEKTVSSIREISRWNCTPRRRTCHGFSTKAQMGKLAVRNSECFRIHRSTSWRSSRKREEQSGKDVLWFSTSALRPGKFSVGRRNEDGFNWINKVYKRIENIYVKNNDESLQISAILPEPDSVGNRELVPKNVNESVLHLENDKSFESAETDESRIANQNSQDGSVQFGYTGDSGNKSEAGYWWEEEVIEDENRLSLPSTNVRGSGEGVEDDSQRFQIRNGREVYGERTYLVGIDSKGAGKRSLFSIKDSLQELAQLADTAGLVVVGSTYQKLDSPNPKTYIGFGKVSAIQAAVHAFKVETIIFDDELSPGQLRNLEKAFEGKVRVCDRTALILDIFKQRAATREATLQVELAQFEYQLPRLTRMWSHLERQAGGMVKGMGEKQIEVDKRILRTRISALKEQLESVRDHRQQYRDRRAAVPIPVVSLVGYTNAGKSTFLNRLSGANVLAEDRLFATLDPTTRRVQLSNGKECLFTDTVGFIQKLPTQLVAAFRATLEEITDSSLLVHMVDISHPMAEQQVEAVNNVLAELDVHHIPLLTVWNKIDKAKTPGRLRAEAADKENVICVSALTGEGIDSFYDAVEKNLKDRMVWIEAVVPYDQGDLISIIHRLGIVAKEEYTEQGTLIRAHVPLVLSRKMLHSRQALTLAILDDSAENEALKLSRL